MSLINQETECQRCGYEHGYHEFSTKTNEQYFMCRRCGHQVMYIIDNPQDAFYKSGIKKGQKRKNWKRKYRTETIVPVASYTIKPKGALAKQHGPVPTDNDLENFRRNVDERKDELSSASITYLASEGKYIGQWVKEDLLKNEVKLIK